MTGNVKNFAKFSGTKQGLDSTSQNLSFGSVLHTVQNAWKLQHIIALYVLSLLRVDLTPPPCCAASEIARQDFSSLSEITRRSWRSTAKHMAEQRRHVGRRRRNGAEPDPPPLLRSENDPRVKSTFRECASLPHWCLPWALFIATANIGKCTENINHLLIFVMNRVQDNISLLLSRVHTRTY